MSKYIEEVMEEFEKKKPIAVGDEGDERINITQELIDYLWEQSTWKNQFKSFIQSALQKQIEMIEGEVEKEKKENIKWFEENWFTAENLYPEYDKQENRWATCAVREIQNKTIDDILSILNQYK